MFWPAVLIPIGVITVVMLASVLRSKSHTAWWEAEKRWRHLPRGEKVVGRFYPVVCDPQTPRGRAGLYGEIYTAGILILPDPVFGVFEKSVFFPWESLADFRIESVSSASRSPSTSPPVGIPGRF